MAWNFQALMDQVALICGGAAVAGRPGVYNGAGKIADIAWAYSRPHGVIDDLPAAVVLPGAGRQSEPDGDVETWTHRLRIWILIGQSEASWADAMAQAGAFLDSFRVAFDAKVTLNGVADGGSYIESYDLTKSLTYAGKRYFGIEFVLIAIEEEAVTRAA